MGIPFLACMAVTAAFYHLPPRVLPSIQAVEGGKVGSISRNADGTEDFGVMQVNSIWLDALARITGMSRDAVEARLIGDACFDIAAAGAILRTYLNEERGDLMAAVGDYHSHTPALNQAYRALVLGAAGRLFGR